MTTPAPQFTVSQLAGALGKSPRVVRRWLHGIAPGCEIVVRGKLASAWTLESLPGNLRALLAASLERKPWQPEFPFDQVCPEQQADALKLQRALTPALNHWKEIVRVRPGYNWKQDATLQITGLRAYEKEYGAPVEVDRWQYLFARTIERAGTAARFDNPLLFVNGNPSKSRAIEAGTPAEFEPLAAFVSRFRDTHNPSGEEIDALWMEALELFVELEEPSTSKKLKRRLLNFLLSRLPGIAENIDALRRNFDRKLQSYKQRGTSALLDGRELKRGEKRAPEIPQADIDRITWHSARNCGSRTAQAVRELARAGEQSGLSATTLDIITRQSAGKSYVNRRLFSAVHPEVKLIEPLLLGKKAKDDATPSLERNYSKLHSMDVVTADDFTMPVYMFVPDGKGWWILTRGQVLLMIDVRSLKIIAYSLQPERSYNALVIRTLMNKSCRAWGLPRVWYCENGIWRNAHLVKGPPREWSEGKSWGELKPGWERLGVKFIHAKKARSKPAELVGGLLQNLMERIPGYCGRDERRDCPEETRRNKLAVEAKRIEPHGLFLSFDAWYEELEKLIVAYNDTVQQGKILSGLSPEQAFEAHWPNENKPVKFDASCWHLLAHYVSERTVGVDGIPFQIGKQSFVYRDENSSALRGRRMLAWFDPECPELLGVTDLNGRNPVLVQRAESVDFLACMDPDGESGKQFHNELAKAAGHNAYPKARYKVLYCKFNPTWRQNLVSPGTAHVAETFQTARMKIEQKQRQKSRRASRTARRVREAGLNPGAVQAGDPMADEGMEMMTRAQRELERAEAEESQPKIYTLDPSKTFTPKKPKGDA